MEALRPPLGVSEQIFYHQLVPQIFLYQGILAFRSYMVQHNCFWQWNRFVLYGTEELCRPPVVALSICNKTRCRQQIFISKFNMQTVMGIIKVMRTFAPCQNILTLHDNSSCTATPTHSLFMLYTLIRKAPKVPGPRSPGSGIGDLTGVHCGTHTATQWRKRFSTSWHFRSFRGWELLSNILNLYKSC